MNNSGDAAEQVVRMSLEGTEVALKLTGSAAKNIAAALYAVYKNRDKTKTKGRQRLTAMLKSGKELKVFTVSEEHLKQFAREAKRYGVVYCALKNGKEQAGDGMVDVMVRAEDASKINRIVERFQLSTVDAASIKTEIGQSRAERAAGVEEPPGSAPAEPEQAQPQKNTEERLVDELLGAPARKEERESPNPAAAQTEKSPLSAPTSETPDRVEGDAEARPSVRKEIRDIREQRRQTAQKETGQKPPEQSKGAKQKSTRETRHQQPKRKKKKRAKER